MDRFPVPGAANTSSVAANRGLSGNRAGQHRNKGASGECVKANSTPARKLGSPNLILEKTLATGFALFRADPRQKEFMAVLIDAINIKRRSLFELDNTPFYCIEAEVSTPTARGGQTLVRLKIRNLLTSAVFEKTFKAGDKFKEPDLQLVPASYLYSNNDGSHFLDQDTFETLTLTEEMIGNAMDFLVEGALIQLHKYNGNPIGLQLPPFVELNVAFTEPGVRGDSSSGSVTKPATLETGLEIRVPLFIKQGEKVKVSTETREFSGRA
jgi:elongation factor P